LIPSNLWTKQKEEEAFNDAKSDLKAFLREEIELIRHLESKERFTLDFKLKSFILSRPHLKGWLSHYKDD